MHARIMLFRIEIVQVLRHNLLGAGGGMIMFGHQRERGKAGGDDVTFQKSSKSLLFILIILGGMMMYA